MNETEQRRLNDAREAGIPWQKWRPYLSERQQRLSSLIDEATYQREGNDLQARGLYLDEPLLQLSYGTAALSMRCDG